MKKFLITIVLGFVMQHYSNAQSSFDPTWANRFQEVLDSIVAADNIMGATAAVLAPGEGIWSGISGNSMPGVPLTSEMRFGIGSNTKLFIAVMMMKLQEEGLLSLDDHLYQWLPSYQNIDSSITIRQLLSHQSGIYNFTDRTAFWNAVQADTAHFWTPQDILGYVLAPNFEPGSGWRYSNTNYILAGMIIEAATGKTWVQKLHEIIFDPLEMDSTFVGAYEPANGPIAAYQWWGGGGPWFSYPVTSYFSSAGSAGAILSTGKEMVQWYNALIGGEILSDSSLQQLLNFEAASSFGLGIVGDADGSQRYPWYNHGGTVNTHNSQVIFDLKTKSVFYIVKNVNPPLVPIPEFINLMMQVLYYEYPQKPNDAGIIQIAIPGEHVCTETVVPQGILKNFGSVPLTSVSIYCKLDSGNPSMCPWTGNLSPGDSTLVSLGSIIPGNGFHTLTVYTSDPNNASDGYPYNDTTSMHFIENLPPSTTFPLVEDFEDPEFPVEGWISVPDIFMQWGRTLLTSFTGTACAVKNNYWDWHIGARFNLDMPMINLTGVNNPMLYFTYAYTAAPQHFDTLKIQISTDCGSNWQTLFYKGGYDLRTAPYSTNPFFPKSNQWRNEVISLGGYTGDVMIRFQNICGNGNNLFLDDVRVDYPDGIQNERITDYGLRITNWPNPFIESTTFSYSLNESSQVILRIYNSFGQMIAEPLNTSQSKGEYRVQWNAGNLPSGMYYYRIQAGSKIGSGKMVKW